MHPSLEMLDLSYQCLPADRCSSDRFKVLPGLFQNMTGLQALKMSGLKIHRFYKDTLRGLENLEEFHLDDSNSLSLIENGALSCMPNLKWLDLSNNPELSYLTTITFHGLGNLEYLDMSYSSKAFLNMASPVRKQSADLYLMETLKKVSSLRVLLLKCALTENCVSVYEYDSPLEQGLLSQMPYLQVLDLSENALTSWADDRFLDNTGLEELYLENNSILFITDGMLQSFRRLKVLDLRGNAITCNGMVSAFYETVEELKPSLWVKGWSGGEGYVCYQEEDLMPISFKSYYMEDDKNNNTTGNGNNGSTIPGQPSHPELPIILISILGTLAVVILASAGVAYRQRFRIRYYFLSPRKGTVESGEGHGEEGGGQFLYDVFISYAQEDSQFVHRHILPVLEETSPRVKACVHERDFEPGEPVTQNIVSSIGKSRKFMIVLTESYVQSKWCMFEAHLAQKRVVQKVDKDKEDLENINNNNESSSILVIVKEMPRRPDKVMKDILRTWTYLEWPEIQEKGSNYHGQTATSTTTITDFNKRLKHSVSKTRF